jgi:hypothetical protein
MTPVRRSFKPALNPTEWRFSFYRRGIDSKFHLRLKLILDTR